MTSYVLPRLSFIYAQYSVFIRQGGIDSVSGFYYPLYSVGVPPTVQRIFIPTSLPTRRAAEPRAPSVAGRSRPARPSSFEDKVSSRRGYINHVAVSTGRLHRRPSALQSAEDAHHKMLPLATERGGGRGDGVSDAATRGRGRERARPLRRRAAHPPLSLRAALPRTRRPPAARKAVSSLCWIARRARTACGAVRLLGAAAVRGGAAAEVLGRDSASPPLPRDRVARAPSSGRGPR